MERNTTGTPTTERDRAFWDAHARRDPLWAILSEPGKAGRRWDLRSFLETGRREVSLLMYQLAALGMAVDRRAALDFGCGVGRLSLPLSEHFDRVVGVDISPEMIRLAHELNAVPDRVQYVCNEAADLSGLSTGEFTFMYSNVVLQHIEPASALGYLHELFRVVAPGGILVFQLPSHPRPPDQPSSIASPMPDDSYRAAIRVYGNLPGVIEPGARLVLEASLTNASPRAWSQATAGSIRFGNHWWDAGGHAMLIQDDGRATLPAELAVGETCHVTLEVTAPLAPGGYQLECDVVHEGVSWFADKGSDSWRRPLRVGSAAPVSLLSPGGTFAEAGAITLPEVAPADDPGALPMHGIHRDVIQQVVRADGGRLVHVEVDERCGKEWVGYRYFVARQ